MREQDRNPAAADWLVDFLNMPPRWPMRQSAQAVQVDILALLHSPNLEARLFTVAGVLNDAAAQGMLTPQWQPEVFKPTKSRLQLGQGVYKIGNKRITFRPWRLHDTKTATQRAKGPALAALAYLLESGKLDRLRRCEVCKRFFFAQHNGKRVCSDECAKTKNRRGAPERMKLSRTRQKAAQAKRGKPNLIQLARSSLDKIRAVFGERFEEFLPFAERIKRGSDLGEVWKALPPRLKKALASAKV